MASALKRNNANQTENNIFLSKVSSRNRSRAAANHPASCATRFALVLGAPTRFVRSSVDAVAAERERHIAGLLRQSNLA